MLPDQGGRVEDFGGVDPGLWRALPHQDPDNLHAAEESHIVAVLLVAVAQNAQGLEYLGFDLWC
jgi:hypothetical protein